MLLFYLFRFLLNFAKIIYQKKIQRREQNKNKKKFDVFGKGYHFFISKCLDSVVDLGAGGFGGSEPPQIREHT